MGKITRVEYVCDRCGKIIDRKDTLFHVGRFRFMHVFKWWVPQPVGEYKLHYICQDCFESFKRWYIITESELKR